MHRLLKAHLRKLGLSTRQPPSSLKEWQALLSAIDTGLTAIDCERDILRRSNDRAADETRERYERLRLSTEERYRNLFEHANDIIYTVDLQGHFTTVNRAGEVAVGYDRAELIGKHYSVIVAPEYVDMVAEMTRRKVQGDQAVHRYEIDIIDRSGLRRTVELNTRLITRDGHPEEVLGLARDVSERKEEERQLRHVAEHDPLTGLPNRLVLQRALRDAIDRAGHGRPSVLAFVDLDNFKVVNDSLGHAEGDGVLLNVATLLRGRIRPGDLLVRLGGDEFAILLRDTGAEDAITIVDRLRAAITEAPFIARGRAFELGVSAGLCPVHAGALPEAVLAHADSAMYEAKNRGGNQVLLARDARPGRASDGEPHEHPLVEIAYEPVFRPGSNEVVCYFARPLAFEGTLDGPTMLVYRDRDTIEAVFEALTLHPASTAFVSISRAGQSDPHLAAQTLDRLEQEAQIAGRLGFFIGPEAGNIGPAAPAWVAGLRAAGAPIGFQGFAHGLGKLLSGAVRPGDLITVDPDTIRTLPGAPRRLALLAAALGSAADARVDFACGPVRAPSEVAMARDLGIGLVHGPHLRPPGRRPHWDGRLAA